MIGIDVLQNVHIDTLTRMVQYHKRMKEEMKNFIGPIERKSKYLNKL